MTNNFGEFIYELRKEKRMTQTELADKLNITNKAVSKWETGDAFPETAQLVPLASIFGITVDELLRGERDNAKEEARSFEVETTEMPKLKPIDMKESISIALAIALILAGVITLVILSINSISYGIYVSVLLGCVAIAVFVLISMGTRRSLRSVELDNVNLKRGKLSAFLTAIGVSFIILFVIPLLVMLSVGIALKIYLPVFLVLEFIAISIVILGGIMWDNFSKSFNIPTEDQLPEKYEQLHGSVCGIIMLSATAVYLVLGFVFNLWHPGWVIYPIAGVLCALSNAVIGLVSKKDIK